METADGMSWKTVGLPVNRRGGDRTSIALLKHSKILISNDSAPTHLGVCADIPVLTLYCSTVPDFGFYPYNNRSRWLSYADLTCKPCGIHGYEACPLKHFQC